MDLNRYMRAKAAKRMETVEARRRLQMAGKLEATALDADEWELILEMDELEAGYTEINVG